MNKLIKQKFHKFFPPEHQIKFSGLVSFQDEINLVSADFRNKVGGEGG